jgi:hypothetical protein
MDGRRSVSESIKSWWSREAVARKLGWEPAKWEDGLPVWRKGKPGDSWKIIGDLPDYCDSIEAAWEIMERLAQLGFYIELPKHGRWNVDIEHGLSTSSLTCYEGINKSAPMAICLAFLKLP